MKRKLYISPFSLNSLQLTDSDFLDQARRLGFDGIEVERLLKPEYADAAEQRGLALVHARLPYETDGRVDEDYIKLLKERGIREVAMINTETAQRLQSLFQAIRGDDPAFRYRGIPGAFGSYDTAMLAAEQGQREADIAGRYGLKVIYHNHTHEFRIDRGDYVLDTYLKNTPDSIMLQLDIGWALCAGVDVLTWMRQWPGRIASLHVKPCNWVIGPEALGMTCPLPPDDVGITRDHMQAIQAYADSPQGPMALNIVDWTSLFTVAEEMGCMTFIHERERIYIPGDILACVREDYAHLRACLAAMPE